MLFDIVETLLRITGGFKQYWVIGWRRRRSAVMGFYDRPVEWQAQLHFRDAMVGIFICYAGFFSEPAESNHIARFFYVIGLTQGGDLLRRPKKSKMILRLWLGARRTIRISGSLEQRNVGDRQQQVDKEETYSSSSKAKVKMEKLGDL